MRATWKILNKERGKTQDNTKAPQIIHQKKLITNQKTIADLFNNYFLSITDLSNSEKIKDIKPYIHKSIEFLSKHCDKSFSNIIWQYVSTQEIERIIRSLKATYSTGYDDISN